MKILLISGAEVPHTMKWAAGLSSLGIDVGVYTLGDYDHEYYKKNNVTVFQDDRGNNIYKQSCGSLKKIEYFRYVKKLKKIIREFNPDILHAHYASGNALLGALTGFHPYVISVWGSDVYEFPQKSILHRMILKFNLSKADKILSTSHVMAKETSRYTNKEIVVIPFGIDLNVFKPLNLPIRKGYSNDDIIIGTIKTLEEKYGVEYLIRAFSIVKERHKNLPLKLLIVGGGSLLEKLKSLAQELSISSDVIFTGRIPWAKVPYYDNIIDIPVFLSTVDSESFGVAIIEASACEKPVIVSDVGGLPEVVDNEETGFVVPRKNEYAAAEAIERLIVDFGLRVSIGKKGREKIKRYYDWNENLNQMIKVYKNILNS